MLKTNKIADLHVHMPTPDIDDTIVMLGELVNFGIKDINLAAITYLSHPVDENTSTLYCKEVFKDANISVFGGLYYHPSVNHFGIPFLDQAQRLLDMGCDGIKLIEDKPQYRKYIGFGLNSKIYDEMFDMLEENQVPILCHVNDPEEFWHQEQILQWPNGQYIIDRGWCYDTEDYLTYNEIFNEVLERLERNPKLNIVFAHFMFISENIELAEKLLNTYPNLKFDLTPGWEMYVGFMKNYDKWRQFFEKYSNRILYGTDTHFNPIRKKIHETVRYAIGGKPEEIVMPHVEHARMRGFDLSVKAQENICYNNYVSFIGQPKAVNRALLVEEAKELQRRLTWDEENKDCMKRLERIITEFSTNC